MLKPPAINVYTATGISKLLSKLISWEFYTMPRTEVLDYGFKLFDWLYAYSQRSGYEYLTRKMRVIDLEYTEFLKKPWDPLVYNLLAKSLEDFHDRIARLPEEDRGGEAILRNAILRRLLMCYYTRSRLVLYLHSFMLTLLCGVLALVLILGTFT